MFFVSYILGSGCSLLQDSYRKVDFQIINPDNRGKTQSRQLHGMSAIACILENYDMRWITKRERDYDVLACYILRARMGVAADGEGLTIDI